MCEPATARPWNVAGTGMWVLAAFGCAGVLRVMAALAGWASLLVPALLTVAVAAVVVTPAVVHYRRARTTMPTPTAGRATVRILPAPTTRVPARHAALTQPALPGPLRVITGPTPIVHELDPPSYTVRAAP